MLASCITIAALLWAALGLRAEGPVFAQDTPNSWSNTASGSIPAAPHGQLAVVLRGGIIFRGGSGDRVTYKLTQRVHANSAPEALQLLGSGRIEAQTVGNLTRIVVRQDSAFNVVNELEISAPRQMTMANLDSLVGGIEAYDFDGGLQARTPAGDIRADRISGFLSATVGNGRIVLGRIGGVVQCYAGAGSITIDNAIAGVQHCQTGAGEIVVKEAGAPVVLDNQAGNITVGRAAGSVEAHAASGLIQVGQAGGIVTADTRGGSIQVGSARGIRAESAQGAVRVREASGPMTVSTALGNIMTELAAGARLQDSLLATNSGDVTVLIPSNLPLSIRIANEMGGYPRFISDFPEIRHAGFGFSKAPLVEGVLAGGGSVLQINAGTGIVYLRRIK